MSCSRAGQGIVICLLFIGSSAYGQPSKAISQTTSSVELFEEVWQLCLGHFYSPTQPLPDWIALRAKYRPKVEKASSLEESSAIINLMLSQLRTSHTYLYTPNDWEYYDLLDLFRYAFEQRVKELFPDGKITYPNIGIFTVNIQGKTFVEAVLDGGPAFKAGILVGDQICSVDGKEYHPVKSLAGKTSAIVRIQRSGDPGSVKDVKVTPEVQTTDERYMEAMKASTRIIKHSGYGIGYIHVWSFVGTQYYLELLREIQDGGLRDADALVLDLREGWGGANNYYLTPFDPAVPTEVPSDNGKNKTIDFKWKKPVVFLVNEKTRSGKETLVYGFKQKKLGTVVGTTTAGANVSGRPFLLKEGSLLMLAVKRPGVPGQVPPEFTPEAVEGKGIAPDPFLFLLRHPEAIEGKGVAPDVNVKFPLQYAQGYDPQLAAAIRTAVASIQSSIAQ